MKQAVESTDRHSDGSRQ